MNESAMGGLLLVVIGAGIAWLWYRGYFSTILSTAEGGLAGTTEKKPFDIAPK